MQSKVAVFDVTGGIHKAVASALEAVEWRNLVDKGTATCFKVNLTHDLLLPGSIVSPAVIRAVYDHMKEYLGTVAIAESSQVVTDADKAYQISGYKAQFEPMGLVWHNMTHHSWFSATIDEEQLLLPSIVKTHEVVNLCVMKTHFRSTVSGALKNFWGFLETGRERFHVDLSRKIAQLHSLISCRLHIMDAVVAMEGNGPKSGKPKEVGLILVSSDPVALDSVAAHLMGFDPSAIDHIQACERCGLGNANLDKIELIGDGAERKPMQFLPAKMNFIARIEDKVKKLKGGGGQLHGGPLKIMSTGARLWYSFAYSAFGTKRRVERFLEATEFEGKWGERS